jgi:hypothetical protein
VIQQRFLVPLWVFIFGMERILHLGSGRLGGEPTERWDQPGDLAVQRGGAEV